VKYVELNPVRAGLVERPWEYPWSSAQGHSGGDPHPILKLGYFDSYIRTGAPWIEWLSGEEDEEILAQLRANTSTGWPTGNPEFIASLEARLGRRLIRAKAGRRPKDNGNT
jgi:putative transposase